MDRIAVESDSGKNVRDKLFAGEYSQLLHNLSPKRLLLFTLAAIYVTELLVMLFIEVLLNEPLALPFHVMETVLDATILAVLVFPMIYSFSFRPLRNSLTALQQTQESLTATLSLLEKTFSSLGEIVFVLNDRTQKILLVNQSVSEVLGYSSEEMVGRGIDVCFADPETYQIWSQQLEGRLPQESHVRVETVFRAQGGQTCMVETTVSQIHSNNGEPTYRVLLIRDVTQQRVTEEKIRLQTAALEAAANGIVITDRNGRVEWINPAFCAMTGYSGNEMVGSSLNQLKSGQHGAAFYQTLWQTVLAGQVWSGEIVNRHKNGRLYTEEQTIAPVRDRNGAITHFIAIKQDISQRKEVEQKLKDSETRYRSLVETSPDGILLTSLDGKILFCNEQMAQMTGAENPQSLIGHRTHEFLTPEGRFQAQNNIQQLLTNRAARSSEYEIININGELLPVEISSSVIEDQNGQVIGLTSMVRNISARKKAEFQLSKQNQELQTLSQLSRSLVSSLEMDVVLSRIVEQIMPLLAAECLTILLREGEELVCQATGGLGFGYLKGQRIPIDDELLAPVLAAERPYLSTAVDCLFYLKNCAYPCYDPQRALMLVPLRVGQETIGLMQAIHSQQNAFDEEDSRLILAAASWAAVAINHARQHTRIQRQLRETETLARINQALNESLEMDKLLQLIADSTQVLIPQMDQVVIHLADEQERILTPVIWSGVTEPSLMTLFVDSRDSLLSQALSTQSIMAYPDLEVVKTEGIQHSWSTGALLVAPLIANGERELGAISLRSLKPFAFSAHDEVALSRLAASAAIAIESSRLYQSERSQRQIAEALVAAAKVFSQSLQLGDVLNMVLQQCQRVAACDEVTILLGADGSEWRQSTLATAVAQSIHLFTTDNAAPPLLTATQHEWMVQTNKPVLVELKDFSDDQQKASPILPETMAVAPLSVGQQTIGFLIAHHSQLKHFDTSILRRLEALASQAALAIHNAQMHQDLQALLNQEQAMRQRLIQTEKLTAMGRMIASVAHEMNNPLQTIKNCLFISQRRLTEDHPISTYLEMASSETGRLSDLVVQLREVYRPQSSQDIVPFSVQKLIEETQAILQPHFQQNQVRWVVDTSSIPADFMTLGIANQLKQVLLNISLNAVDAMQPQGGELTLRTLYDLETDRVGLQLQDTGPGLDEKVIPNLFEPFFTTKESGIGLGLAICYDIVQNHGGQITVENAEMPRHGAVFTIWLPCNGR
ncbi:MAG: PAS domain S-box protein [Chloroflexi bacterium]|nr:PAS domain S-box protein [Chloroflexota bacterium]MBP7591087.1 PAS domain S-box protein [Chloroflexota bacterium]